MVDFKEFSTNYLNPVFVLYRMAFLTVSFFIFSLSMPMFISRASRVDMLIILIMSLILATGLYVAFRRRVYLLYLIMPCVLVIAALSIRGEGIIQENLLKTPMIMCWASAFLLAFNGFRSWGYGISVSGINRIIKSKLDDMK